MNRAEAFAALDRIQTEVAHLRAGLERQQDKAAHERLLGIDEAAHAYGVSPRQMRRIAKAGVGRKIGKLWFVDPDLVLMPRR